jgi:hypothetical protein
MRSLYEKTPVSKASTLVAHAEGEAWYEAAMVVGDLYISNPQLVST